MNYQAHYDRLVERARNRTLEGYVERHHVVPRCMGGSDDVSNIVVLTAREHFVAHQLLVKMYPSVGGLIAAVRFLTSTRQGNPVTNRMYAWLRIRHATEMSRINKGKKMTPEQIAKAAASHLGKKRSEETRKKISVAMSGKTWTSVQKESLKHGRQLQNQARKEAGIPHHNAGRTQSEEEKLKKSLALKGRIPSPEVIAKRTAARNATYAARRAAPCV